MRDTAKPFASERDVRNVTSADGMAPILGFAKVSRRRRGPSVEYRPHIFGGWLTGRFIAEVEAHYNKLVHRRDPRRIVREIAKRTGATEESVAHILLFGKLRQYRAEAHVWRRFAEGVARRYDVIILRRSIAQTAMQAREAGAAVWKRSA
jgi:hypothetical protein